MSEVNLPPEGLPPIQAESLKNEEASKVQQTAQNPNQTEASLDALNEPSLTLDAMVTSALNPTTLPPTTTTTTSTIVPSNPSTSNLITKEHHPGVEIAPGPHDSPQWIISQQYTELHFPDWQATIPANTPPPSNSAIAGWMQNPGSYAEEVIPDPTPNASGMFCILQYYQGWANCGATITPQIASASINAFANYLQTTQPNTTSEQAQAEALKAYNYVANFTAKFIPNGTGISGPGGYMVGTTYPPFPFISNPGYIASPGTTPSSGTTSSPGTPSSTGTSS